MKYKCQRRGEINVGKINAAIQPIEINVKLTYPSNHYHSFHFR